MRLTRKNVSADLLVVGAGPVGLAMAVTAARHGLSVVIVDRADGPTSHSKAIGVHARTLELMHTLDLADTLVADGYPMRDYAIYEGGKRTMATSFRGIDTPFDFVLGLPQSRTEARLIERLADADVEVLWAHSLEAIEQLGDLYDPNGTARAIISSGDHETAVTSRWIVGADGGRSTTRELAGIGFPGGSYGNAFMLGDVRLDWKGERNELQFHLSRKGYLLLIPMPNGMHRVIAQTDSKWEDFQDREKRPGAALEALQVIIDERGPGGIRAHSPAWLTAAPFYHRLAERSRTGRVFLAGDAMHLVSPLGAQGLNTGFGDAFNLGWKLGLVRNGLADAALLETYESERRPLAEKLIAMTSRTTRYITATKPHERLARRIATKALNSTHSVQRDLPTLLSGIKQAAPSKNEITGRSAVRFPAGARLPSVSLRDDGETVDLGRYIHGRSFRALFVMRRVEQDVIERLRDSLSRLAALQRLVSPLVIARETSALGHIACENLTWLEDPYARFTDRLASADAATILVRPDGFVAASADGIDSDLCPDYFAGRSWRTLPDESLDRGEMRYVA